MDRFLRFLKWLMKGRAHPTTVRWVVEVDCAMYDELQELQRRGGARGTKELFNVAFALLKWAARKAGEGAEIAAVNHRQGTFTSLEMSFLENYAASAAGGPQPPAASGATADAGEKFEEPNPEEDGFRFGIAPA